MYCFSLLVNCCSLQEFELAIQHCTVVFTSQTQTDSFKKSIIFLQEALNSLGIKEATTDLQPNGDNSDECSLGGLEEDTVNEFSEEEQQILSKCRKPFLAYFKQKLSIIDDTLESSIPNKLYQPKWLEMMEAKWLHMVPFWTCILRG